MVYIFFSVHTFVIAIVKQCLCSLKSEGIIPKKRSFLNSNTYETYQNVFKLNKLDLVLILKICTRSKDVES